MKRDAKRNGVVDDETQVSAAERVSGGDVTGVAAEARKGDHDADWLSMTTGDPALYLKDAE